jgi:hypothetical protein
MATVALVGLTPDLLDLFREVLRDEGLESRPFPLHADVVAVLGKVKLAALVVDGHPYSNVIAFVRALRDHAPTRDVPVVVTTGKYLPELDGTDGHIVQVVMPFELDDFTSAVRAAVGSAAGPPLPSRPQPKSRPGAAPPSP